MSLAAAVTEYFASKQQEQTQGAISLGQLNSIRYQLGAFQRQFPAAKVAPKQAARRALRESEKSATATAR